MVWLLRHEPDFLVDLLVRRRMVPRGRFVEMLPTETWPIGEDHRNREIRADLVMRLWPFPPPEKPSLELIQRSDVIGLIGDFQNHRDRQKLIRIEEYPAFYRAILGPDILYTPMTFEERVGRWLRAAALRSRGMRSFVWTPRWIPRRPQPDPRSEPRRALLDAMIHARGVRDLGRLENALRALRGFEGHEFLIYQEMLLSQMERGLMLQARRAIEDDDEDEPIDRTYVPSRRERKSFLYVTGYEEGAAEGKLEGKAGAVIDVLRLRGLAVDDVRAARLRTCTNEALLSTLLERALVVATVEQLDDLLGRG
jgi:hypothetical protein